MAISFTGKSIVITNFSDGLVDGPESVTSFTVTGTGGFSSGPPPSYGNSSAITLNFGNGITQTFSAVVSNVNNGLKTFDWTLTDTNLASTGLTSGAKTVSISSFGGNTPAPNSFSFDYVTCFVRGTLLSTPEGERAVENLLIGELICTSDGPPRPIKWIGNRQIDVTSYRHPERAAPIQIRQGAFAPNTPHRDLLVSPDHAILVDRVLVCARQLINRTTISQDLEWGSVEYFHVELDSHAILIAEGLAVESYLDTGNRGFFVNGGEAIVLHPDMTDEAGYPTREANSCAPFVTDETRIRPIWQRLADRAAALGSPVPTIETTDNAALHLVAEGRAVQPVYSDAKLTIFMLPDGITEVRLASRTGSPTDTHPWLEDRRTLGVRVARMVLRDAKETYDVPIDHPGLTQGWWAVEHDGPAMRRWTNGDATLPLPKMSGVSMLEIHLSDTLAHSMRPDGLRRAG